MYIYQSLATSILYTIKFLNILTSPSMCKQEDYFKKLIYMHNKKNISMSCKHREAQAVQSFGIRDNRALHVHISWLKTPVQASSRPPKQKNKKLSRCRFIEGSIFPLQIEKFWLNLFFSLFVSVGGRGRKRGDKKSGRSRSQLLKCTRSKRKKKTNYNIQSIPLHTDHTDALRSEVFVLRSGKTDPSCAVLRKVKYSEGLMSKLRQSLLLLLLKKMSTLIT